MTDCKIDELQGIEQVVAVLHEFSQDFIHAAAAGQLWINVHLQISYDDDEYSKSSSQPVRAHRTII